MLHPKTELVAVRPGSLQLGFTVDNPEDLDAALKEALASNRTCVVDARVDPREHCFPMIPAGAAALDLVEFEETEVEATA